uniref:Rap guanine nucleotide exchange factor 4 n=1 Tax=Plectus sambesii TaxID=2011161 RepID=A0A914X9L4_9BILA
MTARRDRPLHALGCPANVDRPSRRPRAPPNIIVDGCDAPPSSSSSANRSTKQERRVGRLRAMAEPLERLQSLEPLADVSRSVLEQLVENASLDELSTGIVLFREGDPAADWYLLLSGAVNIVLGAVNKASTAIPVSTLTAGALFGEIPQRSASTSSFTPPPHCCSALVRTDAQLLRIDQADFANVLRSSGDQLHSVAIVLADIIASKLSEADRPTRRRLPSEPGPRQRHQGQQQTPKMAEQQGYQSTPPAPRDRQIYPLPAPRSRQHSRSRRNSAADNFAQERHFERLPEAAVSSAVYDQPPFASGDISWRDPRAPSPSDDQVPDDLADEQERAIIELPSALLFLSTIGPDALFRMILQKASHERTAEELELVYEEMLHVKALAHLSTMVKRELASVLIFEHHAHAGTVLFHQGDEGKSWYIILKGSVNVSIHGKGVVCTLHEGDDFGKLALVNDAPRAATIALREDNSHFLRVDKHDFNRILRDVEANTVRLKEHGQDVLVLEKIIVRSDALCQLSSSSHAPQPPQQHRYSVMAGLPEKMLEYLLETRIESHKDDSIPDTFLEDFILTHLIFMPTNVLSNSLKVYYQRGCSVRDNFEKPMQNPAAAVGEQLLACKRRVVGFVNAWIGAIGLSFFCDPVGNAFIEELYCAALEDRNHLSGMDIMIRQMEELMALRERAMQMCTRKPAVVLDCGTYRVDAPAPNSVMQFDTCIYRIHATDGAYFTLKTRLDKTAAQICQAAAQKLSMGTGQGLDLVEVKANGERVVFAPTEVGVPTMLSLNGRLFLSFKDQIDSLVPLPDQDGPMESVHCATLELLSSCELAYQLALIHWQLLHATHDIELISQVIGRDRFAGRVPCNLDLLVRRFNEVQFWTTTEVLLAPNASKRIHLLKKFIKIATQAKMNQDLMSFFAIVLGLSNVAVSRLTHTWDKLPNKFRRQFLEFEGLLDPSRNHRAYRLMVHKMAPPVIPFVPLLLKDLTFVHEGNKTYFDGLINFEKMHMIAQTLRAFRHCKSKPFDLHVPKNSNDAQQLVRNFKVIDNQRRLMELSYQIEPSRLKNNH